MSLRGRCIPSKIDPIIPGPNSTERGFPVRSTGSPMVTAAGIIHIIRDVFSKKYFPLIQFNRNTSKFDQPSTIIPLIITCSLVGGLSALQYVSRCLLSVVAIRWNRQKSAERACDRERRRQFMIRRKTSARTLVGGRRGRLPITEIAV